MGVLSHSEHVCSSITRESSLDNTVGLRANLDDVNLLQAAGAITVVGTVTGTTMTMAWLAPVPVIGGLAAGTGAMAYGHHLRNKKLQSKLNKSTDESNTSSMMSDDYDHTAGVNIEAQPA